MAATLVQSAKGTSNLATTTASFASTPTNGNIIVLCFAADDYNGTPNTGWTESTGMRQQTYHGSYLWWRVASGGSNSFQYTIGSGTNSSWVLMEISGLDSSPYDISNGQFATGSAKTYSTPALTPSAGDRLLVAAVNFNRNSGTLAGNTVTGWTNSFTAVDSIGSGPSGTNTTASLAYRSVTANGSTSYSTSGTSDIDVTSASGLIIAFKVASGGGAVNGSLSQTIPAVTQSATGKVLIQGSVSQTIAAITQTATGKVIKSGSFAQAIDPVTQTASGKLVVSGSLSGTIGDFTLSASGGVAASGSVNATIDPVTQSAVGALVIQGSFGQTIGPVVQNATGAVIIKGSFGQTIDPITLVAAGSSADLPEIEGQFDQTIGPIALDAVGRTAGAQRGDDAPRRRPFVFEEQAPDEPEPAKRTVKRKVTLNRIEKAIELPDPGIPASWIPEPAQAKAFLPAQIAIPSFEAGDEQAIIAAIRDMIVQRAIEQDEEDIEMLLMVA